MDKNRIIAAVKGGMTYGAAAKEFGTTRNVVAGICYRAGVKVGYRPWTNCGAAVRWQRASAADRAQQSQHLLRGRREARERRLAQQS